MLVKVHQILSATLSAGGKQSLHLLVYDPTGSVELHLPTSDARAIIPGHTVLQIENAACLSMGGSRVQIVVPKRSKRVRVQVYNKDAEVNQMCSEVEAGEVADIVRFRNRSKYNFTLTSS